MDLTTEEHKRDVFTVWDCLGQVGGLYGILCPLGAVIVYVCNFLIGSSLDRFITRQLFKFEKKGVSVL